MACQRRRILPEKYCTAAGADAAATESRRRERRTMVPETQKRPASLPAILAILSCRSLVAWSSCRSGPRFVSRRLTWGWKRRLARSTAPREGERTYAVDVVAARSTAHEVKHLLGRHGDRIAARWGRKGGRRAARDRKGSARGSAPTVTGARRSSTEPSQTVQRVQGVRLRACRSCSERASASDEGKPGRGEEAEAPAGGTHVRKSRWILAA